MPAQRPQDTQAVDRWLQLSLAQRYGATAAQPLPETMLKLLGDLKG